MKTAFKDIQIVSRLGADERTLAFDVLDGLTRPFKEIPPKHFYDTDGSRLFEAITKLPEYYPTRTERAILEANAAHIVEATGMEELVELGSGVPTKTLLLLDAMRDAGTLDRYVPFDVSEVVLRESAEMLVERYPGVRVYGVVGDFERHLDALPPAAGPRVIAFLGGTIGNFPPGSRRRFLRMLARALRPQDAILLGTDLVKDPAVLEAAYNDSAGVTAAFNRNVLAVINRELDADFDLDALRARGVLRPRAAVDRDAPAGAALARRARAQARPGRALRQPRGAAHRDQREVHATTACTPTWPPPGWSCASS